MEGQWGLCFQVQLCLSLPAQWSTCHKMLNFFFSISQGLVESNSSTFPTPGCLQIDTQRVEPSECGNSWMKYRNSTVAYLEMRTCVLHLYDDLALTLGEKWLLWAGGGLSQQSPGTWVQIPEPCKDVKHGGATLDFTGWGSFCGKHLCHNRAGNRRAQNMGDRMEAKEQVWYSPAVQLGHTEEVMLSWDPKTEKTESEIVLSAKRVFLRFAELSSIYLAIPYLLNGLICQVLYHLLCIYNSLQSSDKAGLLLDQSSERLSNLVLEHTAHYLV